MGARDRNRQGEEFDDENHGSLRNCENVCVSA